MRHLGIFDHQRKLLDRDEVREGLNAAAAVDDERLQRMAGRSATRTTFTRGSSQQRMDWLQKGFSTGDMKE